MLELCDKIISDNFSLKYNSFNIAISCLLCVSFSLNLECSIDDEFYVEDRKSGSDSVKVWGGLFKGQPYQNPAYGAVWKRYKSKADLVLEMI